jgi:alpha-ketoglutarate-dependent taurine dioxygenase
LNLPPIASEYHSASILYGIEVTPLGADTWFNKMYLACQSLPQALRKRVEGLRGDVVMWDNRCVMHRRDALNASARRTMHRTQLLSFELRAAM